MNLLKDMLLQSFTLLGMFIAWVVLDGSGKQVVGLAIILTIIIWVISYPLRNRNDE